MTTIKARKITGAPLFLLPAVLILVLFGIAMLITLISPGRVTTGIYQVVVWEGQDHVTIPTESLSCERNSDLATCTAPVGSRQLTVELTYTGVVEPGDCTARYGDDPVSCGRQMGFYGHASNTIWIQGGLGLSVEQQAELRADVPWWRTESTVTTIAQILIVVLGVAAGAVTFFSRPRERVIPPDRRVLLVIGTTILGIGLFAATGALINPTTDGVIWAVSPFSIIMAGALAAWQWELASAPVGGRIGSAVVTGGVTIFYSGVALLIFGLQSGFID